MVDNYRLCFVTLVFCVAGVLGTVTQTDLDYIARNLHVTYDVINNIEAFTSYKFQLRFANKGALDICGNCGWKVYLCHIAKIESIDSGPATVSHVNGCLFKLEITMAIPAGDDVILDATAANWAVARTDVMPNWYVAADGVPNTKPRILENTARESLDFVTSFPTAAKWKRFADDLYNPYTAHVRYDMNKDAVTEDAPDDVSVVPRPVKFVKTKETMTISPDWVVEYTDRRLDRMAKTLADKLGIRVADRDPSSTRSIWLRVNNVTTPPITAVRKEAMKDAYEITMDHKHGRISIVGQTPSGVFYGMQTTLSLMGPHQQIPVAMIVDAPRYQHRGYMLDTVRNFYPKETVMKMIDIMAQYKMNTLHLRLADDEGWRVEIPGLPELTKIGGKRCHDLDERTCTIPQLGSGAYPTSLGSGYYTTGDYVDILKYAAERYVEVIPEIDSPGHAHAAIKAMEARYYKFKDSDMTEAKRYLLSDFEDTSKYFSVQMYTDNAINPCLNSTYDFVRKVSLELIKMHIDGNSPLRVYHFGGDESPRGAWVNSTACDWLRSQGVTNLGEYFAERVASSIPPSLILGGWEDGLLDGSTVYNISKFPTRDVYANAWQSVWEWGAGKRAYLLANAGFKVIMSQATHLYMDHPYEPDPEERGYYWATRCSGIRKMFNFMPDSLYDNVQSKRSGEKYTREQLCAKKEECPPLEKPENIIGIQGAVFSETVRTREELEYMTFPRMIVQAERAWHKAGWESEPDADVRAREQLKDWERFANILGHKEMARLDQMDVQYRVPPPGARIENGQLSVNCEMPGLPLQYSNDVGTTWYSYRHEVNVTGKVMARTMSADGSRYSRAVLVTSPPPPPVSSAPVAVVHFGTLALSVVMFLSKHK